MVKMVKVRLADEVDAVEMSRITADKSLMARLRAGHRDARQRKGRAY